jgi:hypothetical protein
MEMIPLANPPEPLYQLRTALDGVDYILRLEYNMRDGWYLGISDELGEPITSPHRLVVGFDLLDGVVDERRPPGMLMLLDMSDSGTEAGYEDLDARCLLTYYPLAEVEEIRGA